MNAQYWPGKWFGRSSGSTRRMPTRRLRRTRLFAEYLEDRLAPSGSSVSALSDNGTSNLGGVTAAAPDAATQAGVSTAYGQLPLAFEVNQGQTAGQVQFLSRGSGYALFLTASGAVLSLQQEGSGASSQASADVPDALAAPLGAALGAGLLTPPASPATVTGVALDLNLVGANPDASVSGQDQLPGTSSYFIGNDPSQWHTNIASYGQVAYQGVYPGINLVYYGNQQQLEYDFVVAPGADPTRIRFAIQGAESISLDDQGNLVLSTPLGNVLEHAPVVYQEVSGVRQAVTGQFVLLGQDEVGFQIGTYDASLPLTIDPVLSYSTYLGGSTHPNGGSDVAYGIAVDGSGNAYVTGFTYSPNFPTTPGAFQTAWNGGEDGFVTKLNASGTALVYSTYFNGIGNAIAVDGSGNAYITGAVGLDFPTTPGAFQTHSPSGNNPGAFVTKLNATGTALVYSTLLGGTSSADYYGGDEQGTGIAVDGSGNAYVTGWTRSYNFPTTPGAFQTSYDGVVEEGYNAFVTKLNATGTGVIYSTYLGGSGDGYSYDGDHAFGIAVDGAGNAYVTGLTESYDFPITPGAFETSLAVFHTTNFYGTAFVTKLNATGTALIYSTFLGAGNDDQGNGIAVDAAGDAYVAGYTYSKNFPTTPGAYQTSNGDFENAFVTKLNAAGTALVYSTDLGGSDNNEAKGIAIDASGNAYVTGWTNSPNFPTTVGAFQTSIGGSNGNPFVTTLNATGTGLLYSTYLGGSGASEGGNPSDVGTGIAVDGPGNAYVTGYTNSDNFPTTVGAFQTTFSGGFQNLPYADSNAFVARFSPVLILETTTLGNWTVNQPGYSRTISAIGGTGSFTFSGTGTLPPGLTLSSVGVLSGLPNTAGTYRFTVTTTDTVGDTASRSYTVTINPAVVIGTTTLPDGTVNQPNYGQIIRASGGTAPFTYSSTGTLPPGLTLSGGVLNGKPTAAGSYTFTVTVSDLASATSSQAYTLTINPAVSITTAILANWTVNQPGYGQTINATGGTGSLTFSATGMLPPGLTLSPAGALSGTPTSAGSYPFTVTATDTAGASASQGYTLTINLAVSITTAILANWTVSQVGYQQSINATGGTGTLTFSATGILPAGLALSNAGVLSGTPTAAGTYSFTVTATDTVGASAAQAYTVTINQALIITTTTLATGTVNQPGYSQIIDVSGGTTPLTLTTTSGTLPTGLTLSSGGVLSGIPTAAGSYTFTVTASDSASAASSQSYTVAINPAVSITTATLASWTANFGGYNQTIRATGGTGTLTFSAIGSLPAGVTLSNSGLLGGTPTSPGSYTFTATTTDTVGASASQTYTLTINPALTLSPGVLPAATVNVPYSRTITAGGGTDTVTLTVTGLSGVIPGLIVPASGTGTLAITGTPTATGTETFTLTANDALGASTSTNYSITISPTTVYLDLPSTGFAGSPGGLVASFPININELEDQASTNHVGLASASLAVTFPTGVFDFPPGSNNASVDVSLGSVPLSDSVSPGGAADWSLSAGSPVDGQLNITLTANSGKNITTDSPATGGSLVTINFPVSATYNPASPTAVPITVVLAKSSFHTAISGNNGAYVLKPTPPYAGSITINPSGAGAFSQYLVNIVGSSTVQAGSGLLVAVQAADASGNPVTSYSGPSAVTVSISPTSAGSSVPGTVSINSSGSGFFLATLQKAGSYTISVASGSYTGSASPVTVTPGPAVKLGFAGNPADTPTGDVLPAVSVQVQDLYGNLVSSDNSDAVTLGVGSYVGPGGPTGPTAFTTGSTLTASVQAGVATFRNLTLVTPGSYQLSALVPGLYTGPYSAVFSITPLQVLPGSFVGTPSGFSLQFNAPYLVNAQTPVLYGQGSGTAAAPSVLVTTDPGNLNDQAAYMAGSLLLDPASNTLTFLTTDTSLQADHGSPLLPDGVYTVVLRSSAATNGLQALNAGGGFLDGLATGTPGSGDFTAQFTVNAAAAREDVLWVPATADGPGQALSAPGDNQVGDGYPLYLDDSSADVTSVQVTLNYNPALLRVTGVRGADFSLVGTSTPGQAVLAYRGPALPAGNETPIGFLLATVPGGTAHAPTPYRAEDLLTLSGVALNGGALPVTSSAAVHLVAYVGDADGNGRYSSSDALLIKRVLLQVDTGFAAYPRVDPVIVADTDGSGFIPVDAAVQVNEAGAGVPTVHLPIPPLPAGVSFQAIAFHQSATAGVGTPTPAAVQHIADRAALDEYFAQTADDNPSATLTHRRRRDRLQNTDLAAVRAAAAIGRLPVEERQVWTTL